MIVELRRCVILLVAARTRKFRLTVVQRVKFQLAFAFKTLVTRFTLEISLLAVNKRMVVQVGLGDKSFVANCARKRFFSSVGPLIDFEVAFGGKPLETNFTLMSFFARIFAMQLFCGNILEY